ncbi:unnamed protein product [Calypogeia fissa]
MEQEDHADGQITETSEQISEFPPQAETELEEGDSVAKLRKMEQQRKLLGAEEADLMKRITEMSLKMRAPEGTSQDLIPRFMALMDRRNALVDRRIAQDRIAQDRTRIALDEQRIALQEGITSYSWLKQVMPRIRPLQLGTVQRRRGGGGARPYLDYAPRSFRRWTSFKGDVLNACDRIKDDSKRHERWTWGCMKHHSDADNEGVIRIFLGYILREMAGVRGDCKISVGPLNAMSDSFRDFAVVTPGGEPCLPVYVKKLNWFRN